MPDLLYQSLAGFVQVGRNKSGWDGRQCFLKLLQGDGFVRCRRNGGIRFSQVFIPLKSIKLGDDLQRVLLRYGQPDEIVYYNPLTLEVVNTPTHNLILRYHRTSNIEFTILGDKVVRIFIFLPGQVTFNRR